MACPFSSMRTVWLPSGSATPAVMGRAKWAAHEAMNRRAASRPASMVGAGRVRVMPAMAITAFSWSMVARASGQGAMFFLSPGVPPALVCACRGAHLR